MTLIKGETARRFGRVYNIESGMHMSNLLCSFSFFFSLDKVILAETIYQTSVIQHMTQPKSD